MAHDFSTCPLLIGVDNDSGCTGTLNGYFAGRLDEIRIYGRTLTATEIQTDMNTPIQPYPHTAAGIALSAKNIARSAFDRRKGVGPSEHCALRLALCALRQKR